MAGHSGKTSERASESNTRKTNSQSYVEKSKYGVFDPDEADEDIQARVEDNTPMSKRRIAKEET